MAEDRCDILHNEAALNALKRHQLQSLTKRYGLKSNGKNSEMVQRLQEFGQTMSPGRTLYSPCPSTTPGPNDFFSDTNSNSNYGNTPITTLPRPSASINQPGPGRVGKTSTGSEAWEMLSDSGASLISPSKEGRSDSMRSWKSARNGQKLDEFGGPTGEMVQSGSMSSIKSLASSLKRSASQHLMSRSRRNSINLLAAELPQPETVQEPEIVEEMADSLPPSPASTVGVPRRYSNLSLLERPSTVRLVASPPPPEPESGDEDDDLPFVGTKSIQLLKERRSMAPLRSMDGAFSTSLSRKSMPAISGWTSASVSNIYPPLPPIPAQFQKPRVVEPSMPGALPISPPKPTPTFVFGSPENAVSNNQFSEAGRAILAQMNARMPDGFAFNEELLKGKSAGVDKLVKTSNVGEGGWGLMGAGGKVDRYAEAHQREFSKMRSISKLNLAASTSSRIASSSSTRNLGSSTSANRGHKASTVNLNDSASTAAVGPKSSTVTLNAGSTPGKRKRSSVHLPSAPNGAALPAPVEPEAEVVVPEAKKRRMSVLGTLADAGRSLLSLEASPKKKTKRRSSLVPGGFKSKFGWLGRMKKTPAPVPRSRTPIMPRKTSVYAPRELPVVKPKFDLNASLSRSTATTSKRDHTDYMSSTIAQKQRQASSSAQTVLSVSTARSRSRIPDFGPPPSSAGSSLNTLGLPKPTSSSLATSLRKQSQADIIKKARPAPAPPAESSEISRVKPTASMSSSRLHAPTASSLARMQATVKPSGGRPMPAIPRSTSTLIVPPVSTIPRSTSTSSAIIPPVPPMPLGPFANASSRDNVQFQSNFNVSKPLKPSSTTILSPRKAASKSISQMKSPLKSAPSSRLRAQASGLHAVKSRPDLKKEREIAGRKAEIKARQGRLGEERELRRMLGDEPEEGDVEM